MGKESRAQKIFGELLSDGEGKGVRAAPPGFGTPKSQSALWPQNVPKYQQHPGLRFEVPLRDSEATDRVPSRSREQVGFLDLSDRIPHMRPLLRGMHKFSCGFLTFR